MNRLIAASLLLIVAANLHGADAVTLKQELVALVAQPCIEQFEQITGSSTPEELAERVANAYLTEMLTSPLHQRIIEEDEHQSLYPSLILRCVGELMGMYLEQDQ